MRPPVFPFAPSPPLQQSARNLGHIITTPAMACPESGARFPYPAKVCPESGARFPAPVKVCRESQARFPDPAKVCPESGACFPDPAKVCPESGARFHHPAKVCPESGARFHHPCNGLPGIRGCPLHTPKWRSQKKSAKMFGGFRNYAYLCIAKINYAVREMPLDIRPAFFVPPTLEGIKPKTAPRRDTETPRRFQHN